MLYRMILTQYARIYVALFIVCAITLSLTTSFAHAQQSADFTFTPVLIDEKAKPRDILKQSLTIVNTSSRKLNLYPSVNDINPEAGEQGFVSAQNGLERAASLANWIELSRGVIELSPGEEKTISFVIRVNLTAVPGTYHAYISFYEGSTRESAEASRALGKMSINLEVQADIKEVMQLNTFFSDSLFFAGDDVLFNYQLENIGNQPLQPKGEIRVYDRKGKEVASIDVNSEGKTLAPDEMSQIASVWSAASGFGRYKAFINVDYGKSQTASVQDTAYFWIVPWQQLLGTLVASLLAIIFLALYFHRKLDLRYHARLAHHLAEAGVAAPTATKASVEVAVPEKNENVVKRGTFSFFSRTRAPQTSSTSPVPVEPKKSRSGLREALEGSNLTRTHTTLSGKIPVHREAIDLKKLHGYQAPKPHADHVINLKDSS